VYLATGNPMEGRMRERLRMFLAENGLAYDESIRFTAALMEEDEIIATGSLDGATVKCVAVSPDHQGEDLTARIMTVLVQKAAEDGFHHLMLYTKPRNQHLFAPLGFHPVIRTADVLLMENRRGGLNGFLAELAKPADDRQPVGCIVAHANPFTLGHRYLIETAAAQCAWLHVFILSEDRGMFTPEERLQMAKEGCSDLSNVLIHPTGPYMVSSSTFPTYFLKEKHRAGGIHCELDVRLFGEKIAPALGVTRRYVGTEPNCAVTAQYNAQMKRLLPAYGVDVIEIERKTLAGNVISASRVREKLAAGESVSGLLPESTLKIIHSR